MVGPEVKLCSSCGVDTTSHYHTTLYDEVMCDPCLRAGQACVPQKRLAVMVDFMRANKVRRLRVADLEVELFEVALKEKPRDSAPSPPRSSDSPASREAIENKLRFGSGSR